MNRLSTLIITLLLIMPALTPCMGQDSLMQVRQLVQLKNYFVTQGLPVQHYAFDDALVNDKLWDILNHNYKMQQKKTSAGVLTGLGFILLTVSVATLPKGNDLNALASALTITPVLLISGVACGVASIPLWTASGRSRKARDAAIVEANALLMR